MKYRKLIFVPQFSQKMRYQEWFYPIFTKELKRRFNDVIVLGNQFLEKNNLNYLNDKSMFSPINKTIKFELEQIKEYIELNIDEDDILLIMDLSFPGYFFQSLYHKKCKNIFSYCHATSMNNMDYFEQDRTSKFLVETSHSMLCSKVFVGSEYHKKKLGWSNVEVIGLPNSPFETYNEKKIYDIISVTRPCEQKINKEIERKVEEKYGKIIRKECNSWEEYYKFLSQGKICLFSSSEETFGYSVLESIINNTIPICPNKCSYPELIDRLYLYNDETELESIIRKVLRNEYKIPELLNKNLVDNFFNNLEEKIKKNLK